MTVGADGFDEGKAIAKTSYTHESMVDMILANPEVSQEALATTFGFTQGWVSRVIASDAFQSRLAERKEQLVDPTIAKNLDERLKSLATQSLEIVARKLESADSAAYALEALGLTSRALGYGARPQRGGK